MNIKITQDHINEYFNGKIKKRSGGFPLLIRSLILSSLKPKNIINCWCPVANGTRIHGFDIDLETSDFNNWIPKNKSVWEIGVNVNCKAKANSDWKSALKRKWPIEDERKNYTFVFVTPRIWSQQEKKLWIEEKRQTKTWKDIKVLDAVSLETWLSNCPIVAHNLAIKMGITSNDFKSAEEYIDRFLPNFSDKYNKAKLIIAGRNQYKDKISEWFFTSNVMLSIYAESRKEAGLFVAGSALLYQNKSKDDLLSKLIFVDKINSIEILKNNHQGEQIVVPLNKEVEKLLIAMKSTTFRIISLNIFDRFSFTEEPWKINLGEISAKSISPILVKLGKEELNARKIAKETKGSFHFLEWLLEEDFENAPLWYNEPEYCNLLAALWLIGHWDEKNDYDLLILEDITQQKYSEIEKVVNSFLKFNGPFEKFGRMLDWKGWSYCLRYIADFLTDSLLDRYKQVLLAVLTEVDPGVTLPPEEQWLANIKKKIHPASTYIREGLISSFVLLSLNADNFSDKNFNYFIKDIINNLFVGKGKDLGFKWASLSSWLGDIAEASPNDFLSACERLTKDKVAVSNLFIPNNDLFSRSYHCNLLWALERLAWHEDYFSRIVLILAELHELNFEVKIVNTPMNTLRQLFLPWLTCTLANLKQRKASFLKLVEKHSDTAWILAFEIMPSPHQMGSPITKPKWHKWLESGVPKRTNKEYIEFIEFILLWMIDQAKSKLTLFKGLIDSYSSWYPFSQKARTCFFKELKDAEISSISEDEKTIIYDSIRKFTTRHREFSDAKWALNEELLKPFDELETRFAPEDLLIQNIWIFDSWPELPNKGKMSHEEREEYLFSKRKEILTEAYKNSGIIDLLKRIEQYSEKYNELGITLANINISFADEKYLLEACLNTDTTNSKTQSLTLISSYIRHKYYLKDEYWLERILNNGSAWHKTVYLNLFLAIYPGKKIWDRINNDFPIIKKEYWEKIYFHNVKPDELSEAVYELKTANRPYMAISILGCLKYAEYKEKINSEIVYDVLIESFQARTDFDKAKKSMLGYYICILLNYLENKGYDHSKLATVEWGLFPLLKYEHRRGLKSLQYCINNEAKFLIDLLKLIFRGKHEEAKEVDASEYEKQKARQAYELLREWKIPPYTELKNDNNSKNTHSRKDNKIYFKSGKVYKDKLLEYLTNARNLAKECDRLEVCDFQLGQILAYTPMDTEEIWPCEEVCEILENIDSDKLFHSLESGVLNKRGVYRVAKGGANEISISKQFKNYADNRKIKYQKTSVMLESISDYYKKGAKRVQEQERFEDFWE